MPTNIPNLNLSPSTHDEAAELYHTWRKLAGLVKDAEAALKGYVDEHGPFPVSESKVYARNAQKQESFAADHPDFVQTLSRLLPPAAVEVAITRTCPHTNFDAAVKLAAAISPDDAASIAKQVKATLEAVGLIKHTVRTVYREVSVGE